MDDSATAFAAPPRRGPIEGEHVIGIDADPDARPGYPMASEPSLAPGARDEPIESMGDGAQTLYRTGLDAPTPVFGTAQPPHGLSGYLRRAAYHVPEHHARHWAMLLVADRIDVLEDRLGGALARPLESAGYAGPARRIRENPFAVVAGVMAGVWVARQLR